MQVMPPTAASVSGSLSAMYLQHNIMRRYWPICRIGAVQPNQFWALPQAHMDHMQQHPWASHCTGYRAIPSAWQVPLNQRG